MFSNILNKGKEIVTEGTNEVKKSSSNILRKVGISSSNKPKLILEEVLQNASQTERYIAVQGELQNILQRSVIPKKNVFNFYGSGRSTKPNPELYHSDDEAELVHAQETILENAPETLEQKTQFKSDLYQYFATAKNNEKALENLSINIPNLSVPLIGKKRLFRGTMLPQDVVSNIMKVCNTGDFNKIKNITYELLHGFDKGKKSKNICSVSTVAEIAEIFGDMPHSAKENTHIFISLECDSNMPPKGLVSFDNIIPTELKNKMDIEHEHEILLDPTNNYVITGDMKHYEGYDKQDNYIINVKAWNDVAHKAQQLAHKAQQLKIEKAAFPFLRLPILAMGGLIGAGGHVVKTIYDPKKLVYLGQEYYRRVEALEAPKETSFSDISTIIKNYNKNNDIAQKIYKKDMLDVFVPYKKQEDYYFYEQNLAGKDVTFYNDIIPETSSSDVIPKHFLWLANNDTIPITPTLYNLTQDLNGMQPSHTGVFFNDDKLNRKTAFMIKVMKKYGLEITTTYSVENFHKIDLNQLNYKRALRLFKADNCPAKEQFEKIRNIIKDKYAEFNKKDASFDEKKEYFNNNIANVITKEAKNNNANPEFIKTLTALVVAEWYNIKRQHTARCKETSFSDISTIIKNYNKNNDIAQKIYKKDMLDVFVPYKKQEDYCFYEQNLAGKDVTFYNNIIPKTSSSDVTRKQFSWLADNGAITTPTTDYNIAQDLNGMQPSHTGVFRDDDILNRKTAFMIKVMKKYGLDIKNADTIENFHKIELNQLNYKRALRLFKADNCPAKEQFEKIRNIIKDKYAEFSEEDAYLDEKKEYFNENIANVITKEAKNNNANPEFILTLTALLVAEWYNIKRQHTAA